MFSNTELTEQTDRLNKFALRLTRNTQDASDLLQATLLRALEKKHLFNEGTNLFSWLSKMMYNLFVSKYNRKAKFEFQYDPEPYLERQKVDAPQDKQLELKNVQQAIQTLSQDHQDILIMVCVEGMKYEEVADVLEIPVGTVRSRLSRARQGVIHAMETLQYKNDNTPTVSPRTKDVIDDYCLAA